MTRLEVGQVWVEKQHGEKKEILWVGEIIVVYKRIETNTEVSMGIENFKMRHTLEKPETKLIKLVVWQDSSDDSFIFGKDSDEINSQYWTKKQIIIKDNQLWIEG